MLYYVIDNNMLFMKILLTVVSIIYIILALRRYKPKIELVISGDKYQILLWYNRYTWSNDYKRVYIKLF